MHYKPMSRDLLGNVTVKTVDKWVPVLEQLLQDPEEASLDLAISSRADGRALALIVIGERVSSMTHV